MKKLALFLAMILCLGFMTPAVFAAEEGEEPMKIIKPKYEVLTENPERTIGLDSYEVLTNTSFELMEGEKNPYAWGWTSHKGRDHTYFGAETDLVTKSSDAHTGEVAIHVHPREEGARVDTLGTGKVIPGETYEFSVWMKRLTATGSPRVEIVFTGKYKLQDVPYDRVKMSMGSIKVEDGWVKKTVSFVAPEYSKQATISLRFNGPGEVIWDDVSMLCITNEMPKPQMPDKKPAIKSFTIPDPTFETIPTGASVDSASDWEVIGDVTASEDYAFEGTKSAKLTTVGGGKDAIATLYLSGFEKGATYQIAAQLLNPSEISIDMGYWIHYCSKEEYSYDQEVQLGQYKPRWSVKPSYQWQEYVAEFTPPDDAKSVMIYFRHRQCPGSIYVDDIQIYMVKTPNALNADTDETFYYTEWEEGFVECEPYVMDDAASSRAEFKFYDLDGTVIHSYEQKGLTAPFKYTFPTALMKEKGKEYKITMTVYNGAGTVIQEESYPVYRFDRPTYLGADGVFRKNGKEIVYTLGSGLNWYHLDTHPEKGGITVAQLLTDKSGKSLREKMDKAYEQGMFVLVNLYSGSNSAGHPDRLESTMNSVRNLKDHPALFGWKVIDEPYQKRIPDEQMIAAYAAIRNIDPHHPVYIDDSPMGSYEWLFRYCDIFECDYYGGGNDASGTILTTTYDAVRKASKGRKPFTCLMQAFEMNGYMPSVDDNRHLLYQALFSGAMGYGYHTLGDEGNGPYLEKQQWKDTLEKWAPWERGFAMGCFVTGEYKFVNYGKTDDVLYGIFADKSDLYVIALNRSWTNGTHIDIPLQDGNGTLKVSDFIANAMTGETRRLTGSGTLSASLAAKEVTVWKITPTGTLPQMSHLKNTTFKDVIYYPWAYNAIATLEAKGIVNRVSENWYGPERNITRGDYAMFLVRTLGLTVAPGENFVDVDPKAEYAKELAVGRAAGIINGVGDNKFNPEAEVSRQDMMTMTSRALKLAGAADLSAFADSGIIADYAQSHVAAMVADGLIKGNADGTINPLGNTTRAEAAVIMQRILAK
ncbi:MAG: S-layer homology domain-containing protein [Clostridia bacterium]|nr:S-layer homology domain-containing protein [Clostridia bacterium]